jgi:hypothetical protein
MDTTTPTSAVTPSDRPLGRRALLAGGAAVAGGLALLRAEPAAAATGALQYGAANDSGATETSLTSTSATATFAAINTGAGGSALYAQTTDPSNPGAAIEAQTSAGGHAILAVIENTTSSNAAIAAVTDGQAAGGNFVQLHPTYPAAGLIGQTAGTGPGVWGFSYGTGIGVLGTSTHGAAGIRGTNTGSGPAVHGVSTTDGVGVWGQSASGRGGHFAGAAAQIRLVPAAGNKPAAGKPGDLFVDSQKRLWFCKGGASWAQIV